MTEFNMIELTDAELDAVYGGLPGQVAVQGGLVNVGNVKVDVEVERNLNNNKINVAVLSGGAQVNR